MKSIYAMFCTLSVFFAGTALAREPIPIVNAMDRPVAAASGKQFSAGEVCQTIRRVAEANKWSVTEPSAGTLVAWLSWNGNKHSIAVEIACKPDSYSVVYKDSVNMKYGEINGQRVIHPFYDRHINALQEAVRAEFLRL